MIDCGEDNLVQKVDCLIFHLGQPLPVKIGGAPDFSNNTLEMWRSGRRSPGEKEERRRETFIFQAGGQKKHLVAGASSWWGSFSQCGKIPLMMAGNNGCLWDQMNGK